MHVKIPASRPQVWASLYTPYLAPNPGSCISFYYQIRAGRLEVKNMATPTPKQLWAMGKLPSNEWEFAYIHIPNTDHFRYFWLSLDAKHEDGDFDINIAVDDFQIQPCDFGLFIDFVFIILTATK